LKFNDVIKGHYQKLGLHLINGLARGAQYRVARRNYGDNHRHQYDCYLHRDNDDSRPKIIFLYGGNWQSGSRGDYRFVADTLCNLGFDVFVPDYRLYPEARFEQIIEDTSRAVDVIMADIISGPVFMMGHSAGAQIGALLTLNKTLLQSPERIRGFIGLAGPYDFYPFTEDSHWDLFAPEEKYPESQPVNFVTRDAPPLYLLHGESDKRVRRGHSKSLMEKQREAGGRASRKVYENMGHVDILLSFSRIHRRKSQVVKDINDFILENVNELSAEVMR
jgi:acetyl esterase/lipase